MGPVLILEQKKEMAGAMPISKHFTNLSSNMLLMYVPTTALTGRTVNPRIARNIATALVFQLK
jgi:hypothetical protein